MTPSEIAAIVLAGGASSRFGGDKLAADLGGAPVLHHALRAVAAVADRIVLVIAPEAPEPPLPAELAGRVAVARDAAPHGGPLAGAAAGLALAGDHDPRVAIVVGGDMPYLAPEVLGLLADRLGAEPGLVAMILEASPLSPLPVAVRPAEARDAVASCLAEGRRSLRSLLDAVTSGALPAADWRVLDPGGLTLRDVDTRRDLGRP